MKTWDTVAGVLVMLSSCLTICVSALGGILAGAYAYFIGSAIASDPQAREMLPVAQFGGAAPVFIVGLVVLIGMIFPIFKVIVGFGLIRQKRWAFIILLVLSILEFAGAVGTGQMLLTLNILFGVYALLRLTGSAGPKP